MKVRVQVQKADGVVEAPEVPSLTSAPAVDAMPSPDPLLEQLASLEHDQWCAWAQGMVQTEALTPECVLRWQGLFIPYADLSEMDKEKDRAWARKVLEILLFNTEKSQPSVGDVHVGGSLTGNGTGPKYKKPIDSEYIITQEEQGRLLKTARSLQTLSVAGDAGVVLQSLRTIRKDLLAKEVQTLEPADFYMKTLELMGRMMEITARRPTPDIVVNVAASPAPVVNVAPIPAPVVNVSVPRPGTSTQIIERNEEGDIIRITSTEDSPVVKAEFEESQHPRGAGGQFGSGEGRTTDPQAKSEEVATSLSSREREAVYDYSNTGSNTVNTALRNPPPTASASKSITEMDHIIAEKGVALETDLTVFRGTRMSSDKLDAVNSALASGKTVSMRDPTFKSTTSDRAVADNFMGQLETGNQVMLKIEVPKGTKVLPMRAMSVHPKENEVLLSRNSKYQIVKASTRSSGGREVTELTVRYVPLAAKAATSAVAAESIQRILAKRPEADLAYFVGLVDVEISE